MAARDSPGLIPRSTLGWVACLNESPFCHAYRWMPSPVAGAGDLLAVTTASSIGRNRSRACYACASLAPMSESESYPGEPKTSFEHRGAVMPTVGELIRGRREAFGATISEAARWCQLSTADLAKLENSGDISSTTFERVCRGLTIAPADLLSERQRSPTRTVARFRSAAASMFELEPGDLRVFAGAAEVGRVLASLLDAQGRTITFERHRDIAAIPDGHQPWEHGYLLGETARRKLCHTDGPIKNLERFLNSLDIHVACVPFRTDVVEGAGVWERGSVPVIILNSRAGRVQYRLSRRAILAHELCHLLHDGGEVDTATRVSASEGSGGFEDALEQRARAFAPAFLAPRDSVKEWARGIKNTHDPEDTATCLANQWGLSYEGAIWHAKNTDLMTSEEADRAARHRTPRDLKETKFEIEDQGFPLQTVNEHLPSKASPLMDGWASRVVVQALESSTISLGRAKELLLWG